MTEELRKALLLLEEEEKLLDRWANESVSGGWSTHQVAPMRVRAALIRTKLEELLVSALNLKVSPLRP